MNEPVASSDLDIRVRYGEVDQMGVVHHSRYWSYFEMGRIELLRRNGMSYRDLEESGVYLVVASCSAKYHAPAHYDDLLVLTTTQTRQGRASIHHAYELRRKDDDALIATAETTLACIDGNGRIIPLPESLRRIR